MLWLLSQKAPAWAPLAPQVPAVHPSVQFLCRTG